MNKSGIMIVAALGTAWTGAYGYHEYQRCKPDATGNEPAECTADSSNATRPSQLSSSGSYGHGFYSSNSGFAHTTGSSGSSSSSVSRGGFGHTGSSHGSSGG